MPVFIAIIIMAALAGAEIDLFIPSFPQLQKTFGLTPFMVELTVGLNLAANCVASFFVGNLGDRYGRRPVILGGLVIFVIGSVFCVGAHAYWQLLFGRIFQGVGISAPMILSYVVLSDLFSPEEQQKRIGVLSGVVTLAMAFAPVAGSFVNEVCNWRGNFAVLLILGVVALIMGYFLLPSGRFNPAVSLSLREYKSVFVSKKAWFYNVAIAALCQPYWIFIAISPILYMEDLGVSLSAFGWYQGAMAAAFSLASFTSGFWLRTFGQRTCFFTGLMGLVVFCIAAGILIAWGVRSPLLITIVGTIQAAFIVFPINILWPHSLESVKDAKGKLSAMMNGTRLIVTAAGVQLTSYFYTGTFTGVGVAMILGIVVSFYGIWLIFGEDTFSKKLGAAVKPEDVQEIGIH